MFDFNWLNLMLNIQIMVKNLIMQKDVYFIEPEVSTETFPIHTGNTKYEFLLCIYGSHNAFTLALYKNLLKQEHTKSFFYNIYF